MRDRYGMQVAALDCETSASVCQKYKATSYPTLLWFDKDVRFPVPHRTNPHNRSYMRPMNNS